MWAPICSLFRKRCYPCATRSCVSLGFGVVRYGEPDLEKYLLSVNFRCSTVFCDVLLNMPYKQEVAGSRPAPPILRNGLHS